MKQIPLFDSCGIPISYTIYNLDFISLEDAKTFLKINKNFTFEDIKIIYHVLGFPKFINIEETIKNNYNIVFYKDDEVQWTCSKKCDKCESKPNW